MRSSGCAAIRCCALVSEGRPAKRYDAHSLDGTVAAYVGLYRQIASERPL
jgi:hypothetical protein